jgi:protein involved in sex pheromone biosynthesis
MKNKYLFGTLVAVGLIAVLSFSFVLSGCCSLFNKTASKATEKAIEKATGVEVATEGEEIDTSKLPSELIYPGAKATGSFSLGSEDEGFASIVFETSDSYDNVRDYFLNISGWEVISQAENQENDKNVFNIMLTNKTSNIGANVTIAQDEGKVTITVVTFKGSQTEGVQTEGVQGVSD